MALQPPTARCPAPYPPPGAFLYNQGVAACEPVVGARETVGFVVLALDAFCLVGFASLLVMQAREPREGSA
jgi:hypothetical protein